jgi:hypothetical protein
METNEPQGVRQAGQIQMTMAMHAGELPRWLFKKIIKVAGLTEDA